MAVGVLALQGDFEAHRRILSGLGASSRTVRTAEDLAHVEGLIIPGGESTTMLELLEREKLFEPLKTFARDRPILGTCAGAILIAREVSSPSQRSLGLVDILIERNAYGRQVDSCIRRLVPEPDFERRTEHGEFEAVFIRAPIIRDVGPEVEVLIRDDKIPALIEHGRHLACSFHPELTADSRIHALFLEKVRKDSG